MCSRVCLKVPMWMNCSAGSPAGKTKDDFIPVWLPSLLKTSYSGFCDNHIKETRNGNNFFCIDCIDNAFCYNCSYLHKEHRIIQIRRSSHSDAIRVNDIKEYIDISGIQTYILNKAKVLFLNERPHAGKEKMVKTSTFSCEICQRGLFDACKFCSLGCKVKGLKRAYPEVTFSRSNSRESSSNTCSSNTLATEHTTGPKIKCRRRKGIPCRAPFV